MSTFNLRHEIKAVVRETDLASPYDIAVKVAENIPDGLLREALMQALPDVVRVELTRERMRQPDSPQQPLSAKVAAIREGWRRHLRDRVYGDTKVWLLLSDCSAENFRFAAEFLRTNAERSLNNAARYERYAAACEEHGVSRFGDLPEDVQAALLGGEAS